jgi:hypothetical protein
MDVKGVAHLPQLADFRRRIILGRGPVNGNGELSARTTSVVPVRRNSERFVEDGRAALPASIRATNAHADSDFQVPHDHGRFAKAGSADN